MSASLKVSFRVFEDPERVPTFLAIASATGLAHVPILIAALASTALWAYTLTTISASALPPAAIMRHPDLATAVAANAILRAGGYLGAALWMVAYCSHRWLMPIATAAKVVLVPLAALAALMLLANGLVGTESLR